MHLDRNRTLPRSVSIGIAERQGNVNMNLGIAFADAQAALGGLGTEAKNPII